MWKFFLYPNLTAGDFIWVWKIIKGKQHFSNRIHEPLHNVHVMCIGKFSHDWSAINSIFGQLVLLTFYYVLNSIAQPIKFVSKNFQTCDMKCRNFSAFNELTENFLSSLGMKCTWKYFRSSPTVVLEWMKIPLKFYHNFTLHGCHCRKTLFPALLFIFTQFCVAFQHIHAEWKIFVLDV